MNKKETQAMEDLKSELNRVKAMRFTDVPNPLNAEEMANGLGGLNVIKAYWFNDFNGNVALGCFSRMYHSLHNSEKTDRQGIGGPWYATELEALKAMRCALEFRYSKDLSKIDARINALALKS